MQLGMVGLGRMGGNLVRRLLRGGHDCVVFDLDPQAVALLAAEGAVASASLAELVSSLTPPRAVWLMLPAGPPTEETLETLASLLAPGDALLDGGNSFFKDDVRRAASLATRGLSYLDVGTSGGLWGLDRGYCLMVGGDPAAFRRLEPLFATLAPGQQAAPPTPSRGEKRGTAEEGYLHCGPAGAGHFVKMVHNGIEYGLMQAYAEGFDLLASAALEGTPATERYELPLSEIAELWRRGSVVGSWLLDLAANALARDPTLGGFSGRVEDSGEGRWTVATAVERAVPVDVLSSALFARFRSRQDHTFGEQLLSALRQEFGGHVERGTATDQAASPKPSTTTASR